MGQFEWVSKEVTQVQEKRARERELAMAAFRAVQKEIRRLECELREALQEVEELELWLRVHPPVLQPYQQEEKEPQELRYFGEVPL